MKPARYLTPLSKVQITQLCALATKAFKAAQARGALDDDMTAAQFRKDGQWEAAKVASLKEANQGHYLEIRGKWWTVIGNLEQAFYDFLNGGPENEARRQMAWRLAGQVAGMAEAIGIQQQDRALMAAMAEMQPGQVIIPPTPRIPEPELAAQAWAYTAHLAREKFKTTRLEDLDADQLEQLGFTLVNRANAKRGKGDSTSRNKGQRGRSKPSQETFESDSSHIRRTGHDAPSAADLPQSGSDRL